jgi:hypothetical protein
MSRGFFNSDSKIIVSKKVHREIFKKFFNPIFPKIPEKSKKHNRNKENYL